MRKLHIAYIASGKAPFVRPYMEYFRNAGHDVSLLSFDSRDGKEFVGCPVYDISFGANPTARTTKWRYLLAAARARFLLAKLRPDVLHGHYVTSAGLICWLAGFTPYVVSARGSDINGTLHSGIWRVLLRQVFNRSAVVHTVADGLSASVIELGVPIEKVRTLTQGVDLSLFAFRPALGQLPSPVRLLCTRTLSEIYDPKTIVRACMLLKSQSIQFELTFAADGPMRLEVEALVASGGLQNSIRFLGGFENEELPRLLGASDLFISASKSDGTSISLLEALAAGVFPILSRIPANNAWVRDGEGAVMFDFGDEVQLAGAIRQVVADDDFRRLAVEANRRLVEDKADRRRNMAALEKVYQGMCEIGR